MLLSACTSSMLGQLLLVCHLKQHVMLIMQVEQHKWAEEGAELKGRLTAHEAQLDLMQASHLTARTYSVMLLPLSIVKSLSVNLTSSRYCPCFTHAVHMIATSCSIEPTFQILHRCSTCIPQKLLG